MKLGDTVSDSLSGPAEPHLISVPEAARRLGMSDDAVRRLIRDRGIPTGHVGGRTILDARRLPGLPNGSASSRAVAPPAPGRTRTRRRGRRQDRGKQIWRRISGAVAWALAVIGVLPTFGVEVIPIGRAWAALIAFVNAAVLWLGWRASRRGQRRHVDTAAEIDTGHGAADDGGMTTRTPAWSPNFGFVQGLVVLVSIVLLLLSFRRDDPLGLSILDSSTATVTPSATATGTPTATASPTPTPTPTATPALTAPAAAHPTPPVFPCGSDEGMTPCPVDELGE